MSTPKTSNKTDTGHPAAGHPSDFGPADANTTGPGSFPTHPTTLPGSGGPAHEPLKVNSGPVPGGWGTSTGKRATGNLPGLDHPSDAGDRVTPAGPAAQPNPKLAGAGATKKAPPNK